MIEQELEQLQGLYQVAINFMVTYSFQLVGALFIFLLGLWLANKAGRWLTRLLKHRKIDITLSQFLGNSIRVAIIIGVVIICLGKVGISITPFVAAIGAASLGAGLAFQGLLSNYAAGFAIILSRPFSVGNTITVQDHTGVVKEIHLAYTIITNEEEEDITIPNKYLIGDVLMNSYEYKLVDSSVGVAYATDMNQAIALIHATLVEVEGVSTEKSPQVGIDEFGDSSVNLGMRYWVPTQTYFETKYQANLAVFQALQKAGITIPFPQREVRLLDKHIE
jgi:small conductance mechanosensitive channel|tara:strand:- start:1689 stop:2522 length:834 start_codon:yes stop_codon:yes gene_type:complete